MRGFEARMTRVVATGAAILRSKAGAACLFPFPFLEGGKEALVFLEDLFMSV